VDHKSLSRALAFILGVVLLAVVSWGAFKSVTEARADLDTTGNIETLDTDVALAATIDSLESHWNSRINYHFSVKQDPLFLGRVVAGFSYAKQGFRELDEGESLRLTATVTINDDFPMAIIKFQGKSYVVRVGDIFGKLYEVKDIQEKKVILSMKGKKIILKNKPLGIPQSEYSLQGALYSNER